MQDSPSYSFIALFRVFLHLHKEAEEHHGGNGSSDNIRHRLCQKNCESLVSKEVRQNKDQRNQQNDFAEQRHDQADFRLSQRHKCLLTADLEAYGKTTGKKNPDSPRGVFHQTGVTGKDSRKEIGKNHHSRPEYSGIGYADAKLTEESFLYPIILFCPVVVADQGLPALANAPI